jgi:hypothetical protein
MGRVCPISSCTSYLRGWLPSCAARRPRSQQDRIEEDPMGKTGRKRRARKKKAANHGKRPNA